MPFQKGNQYGKLKIGKHYGGKPPKEIKWLITENGCHICTSHSKTKDGYIHKRNPKTGKVEILHRMIYKEKYGEIPQGMEVCHTCDNPSCINIEHLFLGTHLDNMRDKVGKNRQHRPIGEKNGISKLTEEQVKNIRNSNEITLKKLSKKYKVSFTLIGLIKRGIAWKHMVNKK
jgi:hypothetical protein